MIASELPAVAPVQKENASISDRTLHAILSMAGREVAIKVLALVGWVVLARLLEPEVFGLFAVASFAINLFTLFSEVGLGASLVRARGELHPRELRALFTYQLVWFALPALALFLGAQGFSGGRGMADLSLVLQALAVSFVIISMRTVPSILSQRRLAYGPIVVADVSAQAAFWLVAVGLSLAQMRAWSV